MYLFIINKNSGNGSGARVWSKIQRYLLKKNISYEHFFTENAEQAHSYLTDKLTLPIQWKAVGVVGGDGTIHSLLPALRQYRVPLAVFPAGSGNDTARGFQIPRKTEDALDVMLNGHVRTVDLIEISGQNALTALAVGFDAEVAHNVNKSIYKKICNLLRIGSAAYLIGIFHTLLTFKPASLTVECDGISRSYSSAWLTAISNVKYYGGGVAINPDAKPDDGLLDICIVHNCSRTKLFLLFPTLLIGMHTRLSNVTMLRGRKITIVSGLPWLALGDGERLASTPLTTSAGKGTLQIMCAPPK